MAEKAARSVRFDVEFIGLPGEEIPLEDASVDTVLMTYTLCTIPDTEPALRQMARVSIYPESPLTVVDVLEFDFPTVVLATGSAWRREPRLSRRELAGSPQADPPCKQGETKCGLCV